MGLELILIFFPVAIEVGQHYQTLVWRVWVLEGLVLAIEHAELLQQLLSLPHWVSFLVQMDHVLVCR
jgi:hypothetical protein